MAVKQLRCLLISDHIHPPDVILCVCVCVYARARMCVCMHVWVFERMGMVPSVNCLPLVLRKTKTVEVSGSSSLSIFYSISFLLASFPNLDLITFLCLPKLLSVSLRFPYILRLLVSEGQSVCPSV